ncbi:MAG: response regulator [Gammaproteobacteria bacterium]|jgi:two-component system, OmpR family, response regulator QseB
MRILLVEDDHMLGEAVVAGLRQHGFTVDWVLDGLAAGQALATENFGLVVLDLGLPKRNGMEVLSDLRARGNQIPVLILTARDTVDERVRGLDAGADDYLVKPFDLAELSARVRALIRRYAGRSSPVLSFGRLQLDPAAHSVQLDGAKVELAPREYAVLQLLLENAGRVQSRERLEEALYGWGSDVESNTIEVYIHHLRKKFGKELIRTIRGVGYMVEKSA